MAQEPLFRFKHGSPKVVAIVSMREGEIQFPDNIEVKIFVYKS